MQEIKNIDNQTYRELPAISASDIKLVLENPMLYKNKWSKPKTDSMILGSIVHCLVIEPDKFDTYYKVIDSSLKKKDIEKLQDMQSQDSKQTLIKEDIFNEAKQVSDAILKSNIGNLFKGGFGEASYVKECYGVKCKVRPDYFLPDKKIIIDLKTTKFGGANPNVFQKTITNFKYYIQAAFYLDVLQADKLFFVAVETESPYMIGLFELDNVALDLGRDKIKKAIDIIKNIDAYTNIYLNDKNERLHSVSLPAYAFYEN